MSQETNQPASGVRTQVGVALLLILTFALIGFVALSVVTGNDFGLGAAAPAVKPPVNAPQPVPLGTPDPLALATLKQTALGFSLQYPRSWRKNEQGLRVVLAPAADGLSPEHLQGAAIWFGIPADGSADPTYLLNRLAAELFPNAQLTTTAPTRIGGEQWQSVQVQFESETMGPAQATIAAVSRDEVGYFMVATAPVEQWTALQPVYSHILDSFKFTTQAVLRPTDATPPPTPTPTPTPVFYIVKSGDTLSHVSVMYGVSVEAIMDRNGLTTNSVIRPGDKLLIPRKRQR